MKALLLAAGKATRLGELSQKTPKCLHRVGDEVLFDRVVRQLREVGVTQFLVNTHHLANQVVAHVESRPDRGDFTLVYEPDLLGTLGTLRANVEFFDMGEGWVLHADNFIIGSLVDVKSAFESRAASVWGTMMTFETRDPRACGVVAKDKNGRVFEFHEKVPAPPTSEASAATFVFAEEVFDIASSLPSDATDISRDLIPHLVGHLVAVNHGTGVVDIGTVAGLESARLLAQDEVKQAT